MAKRPDLSSAINMTPFIDIVFQLVIFFIVVNDLSQKELEDLKLPVAKKATKDEPDPGRPILNILEDGTVVYKGARYYWPGIDSAGRSDPVRAGRPDYYWRVSDLLVTRVVPYMEKKVDPKFPRLGELPDEPLLIRADRNTPFKHVQKVMEVCARQGIQIWKVQLAASEHKPEGQPAGGGAAGN